MKKFMWCYLDKMRNKILPRSIMRSSSLWRTWTKRRLYHRK